MKKFDWDSPWGTLAAVAIFAFICLAIIPLLRGSGSGTANCTNTVGEVQVCGQ